MEILDIIKYRCSIRCYKRKSIPLKILLKIIEAGKWGPSLSTMQPSIFVVIKKEKIKNKIFEILEKKLKKLGISGRMIFIPTTMQAVKSAPVLIAIYNTGQFKNLVYKFARFANKPQCSKHIKIAEQAEISAVSAAIQNMILTIEELGLGSCWLHMPLYCEREINSLLGIKNKLVAFLALGYPAEKGERSSRKSFKNLVRF